jgi:hypothetical protein
MNLVGFMWLAAAHLVVHIGLDYLLALMEPRLHVLCGSMGFAFQPIGPGVEFRGLRVPYRIDRRAIRALLHLPELAMLLGPASHSWEKQAATHPLLAGYLQAQPGSHAG